MAITVLGRPNTYAPDNGKWYIITTALATPLVVLRTDLALTTTYDVTGAVATATGFMTGRNIISDSEWGTSAIPFSTPINKTVENPVHEFWADRGGADIRAVLTELSAVDPTVLWLPHGDVPTEKMEVWTVQVADISATKERGAHAKVRVQYSVMRMNKFFTIPA